MGIKIIAENKQFHLFNSKISYMLKVNSQNEIEQLYFGNYINVEQVIDNGQTLGVRPMCCNLKEDENFSKDLALFEYPSFGTGDFRYPAYEIIQENGSRISSLKYVADNVYKGKKDIPGLPASYVNTDSEAETLEVVCVDEVAGLEVTLYYTIWEDYPIVCRHARLKNIGNQKIEIERALSCNIDFPDNEYNWMHFEGAWGRERYPVERDVSTGITAIESMRGHSSANYNPFVIIKRKNTDERNGEAFGVNLVYSGNFIAQCQADAFGKLRFSMGINPQWFKWELDANEIFDTPEVVISHTACGLNDLSNSIHKFMNNQMVRSSYKNKPRPILLNNWEATEMDFTEESILKIAEKGKEAGVELFVLDDGWFGKRNDDYAGLGDWFVNTKKLPEGIKGLSEKINDMGLKFGLWIEPEMVNEDSDLFRAHPDWILGDPNYPNTLGRHQMVLDYSKKEVVDNIFQQLYAIIVNANISYIKWDMNRSITECYSIGEEASQQGKIYHKYILGVYDLYERLRTVFPDILFESCASGGARFDAGMLYYAPQAWCSDDTDAVERIKIQYGTSYGYPISMVGSHVSASPNQQTGRDTDIRTRANVAYYGTFGYELDLNELSEEEFNEVKKQIEFMKEYRDVFQYGRYYRLRSPFENNTAAWMVVSEDKNTAIVSVFKKYKTPNMGIERIRLQGLDAAKQYLVNDKRKAYGDYLMEYGVASMDSDELWYEADGDFSSKLYVLKANVTK